MDKFSFYELFSFIAPGFGVILSFQQYSIILWGVDFIEFSNNSVIEIFFIFSLALFMGLLLQILTFKLLGLKVLEPYKKIVYKSPSYITNSKHLSKVVPRIEDYYKKHNLDKEVTKDDIFDFIYYYLEINDKIAPTKNFQSLYFWLRNTLTLCLLNIPLSLIALSYLFFMDDNDFTIVPAFVFFVFNLFLIIILLKPTQWLREKMTIKLFWSFYTELLTNNDLKL